MSKFVSEAMYLAEAMADRACGTECGEFVAKEREDLRAALTARDALLERMAEALKSILDEQDANEGYATPAAYDIAYQVFCAYEGSKQ